MSEQVIDGRWELNELIGTGGGGRVWRVTDRVRGGQAALKLVRTTSSAHRARFRREIAALQTLRISGVVQLIDEGEHLGEPYIVMELLDGTPFPGASGRLSWLELREPTLRLLEILANVHATGIIHRDLKPANIMVDRAGRVVLLDFGLARGTPGDSSVTRDGALIGTPRYLAPEQFLGRRVDPRADLFALGVMLYDALAGTGPMDAVSMGSRLTTAHTIIVPPLADTASDVPAGVARVIQALLAPMPGERPASAAETRRMLLAEGGTPEVRDPLPLLAVHDLLSHVVAEAMAGRDVHIAAESGVGRTRFARELAVRLVAAGRAALMTRAGARPLSSVRALVPDEVMAGGPSGVEEALRGLLAAGATVIVDAKDQLDPWSRKVVERLRGCGHFVVLGEPTASLRLALFSPDALRGWFGGFNLFFHVREDASKLLAHRTGGNAVQVAAELDAWTLAGLATREGDKFFLDRDAIDQLEGGRFLGDQTQNEARRLSDASGEELLAWVVLADNATAEMLATAMGVPDWEVEVGLGELAKAGVAVLDREGSWRARVSPADMFSWPEERLVDVHRRLASVFPADSAARLQQLSAAGDVPEALMCAAAWGERLLGEGRAAHAVAAMLPILGRAGQDTPAALVATGVSLLVRAALTDGTARTIAATESAISRLPPGTSAHALQLVRAYARALAGDLREAAAAVERCSPFADELEFWRRALLVRAAVRLGLADPEAVINAAAAAKSNPDVARPARVRTGTVPRRRPTPPGCSRDIDTSGRPDHRPRKPRGGSFGLFRLRGSGGGRRRVGGVGEDPAAGPRRGARVHLLVGRPVPGRRRGRA